MYRNTFLTYLTIQLIECSRPLIEDFIKSVEVKFWYVKYVVVHTAILTVYCSMYSILCYISI